MRAWVGLIGKRKKREVMRIEGSKVCPLAIDEALSRRTTMQWTWGDESLESRELALFLLLDVTGDPEVSLRLYVRFTATVVRYLARDGWVLTEGVIQRWLIQQLGQLPADLGDDVTELGGQAL